MRHILGVLILAALVPTAYAEHCTTWSTSTTGNGTVVVDTGAGWYIVNDLCQPGCLFSVWLYPEANGIPGLQRCDEVRDDTCHGMIECDTLLGL